MDLKNKRVLIAYFSHAGMNYTADGLRDLAVGNTAIAAELLAGLTGGELFEIRAVREYPHDYQDCVAASREELHLKARPELAVPAPDISGFDLLLLGYPCWCGTCPMPVFTFLDSLDLSGKALAPFCTNEGSGMGVSQRDVEAAAAGAAVLKGLPILGSRVRDCAPQLRSWLESL